MDMKLLALKQLNMIGQNTDLVYSHVKKLKAEWVITTLKGMLKEIDK